jgi:hypothetical protein
MSNDQITSYKKDFERRTDEMKNDSERARKILIRAGINTKKGVLRKEYRDPK